VVVQLAKLADDAGLSLTARPQRQRYEIRVPDSRGRWAREPSRL
jgi:hypothetical protein